MRLVLGTEISEIDRMACEICGISGLWLMENAGTAVADFAESLIKKRLLDKNKEILLLAGGGNNGGDALVVARLLAERGYKTATALLCSPEKYKGDAAANWQRLTESGLPYFTVADEKGLAELAERAEAASLIIDGIFGTGFHGSARGVIGQAIEAVNGSGSLLLAIDVPSGVNATDGMVQGPAVRADYTVTFGWAKYGARIYPARDFVGEMTVADIGLPVGLLEKIASNITEVDAALAKEWLPVRRQESHKGTYGHVAVAGGAHGMLGAPILTACGALKSGAGLVTVVSVPEIMLPLACNQPELMCRQLTTPAGYLTAENLPEIADFIKDKVLALGMGLGRNPETMALVHKLCQAEMRGLVLDADGLQALARQPLNFKNCGFPVVLTPHPKEMAALLGVSTAEVQADRLQAVQRAAEKFGAVVLLKGAKTLVSDGKRVFLNSTGNAGMATAGSGDVLSGVIASLLAQGVGALEAAALGAYLHGKAGDIAKSKLGEYGMTAGDLAKNMPFALLSAAEGC